MSFTGKVGAQICPAYAGMILNIEFNAKDFLHLSRVCGDDPGLEESGRRHFEFVPRMRG